MTGIDLDKKIEAAKAVEFLDNHPALVSPYLGDFFSCQSLAIYPVCKNGYYAGDISVEIDPEHADWEKYKDRRDEDEDDFVFIPYEEYFGESWKADRVEYFCEIDFFAYRETGDKEKDSSYIYETLNNWMRYHGFCITGDSFEDVFIKAAKKVKEIYGDFDDHDDWLTEEEKKNHEENQFFLEGKKIEAGTVVKLNPQRIHVKPHVINRRWLMWFKETDYCKENWVNEFDKLGEIEVQSNED